MCILQYDHKKEKNCIQLVIQNRAIKYYNKIKKNDISTHYQINTVPFTLKIQNVDYGKQHFYQFFTVKFLLLFLNLKNATLLTYKI